MQAQASHLRQQVESLVREREAAQASREKTEEELATSRRQLASQAAEAEARYQALLREVQKGAQREEGEVGGEREEAPEQMMQSVIAQRTRGRINDSARQARTAGMRLRESASAQADPEPEQPAGLFPWIFVAFAAYEPEVCKADAGWRCCGAEEKREEQAGDGSLLQSVVAKRTRGRTMDKDYAFFLKHLPVVGAPAPVKIPETVQLSHTGSVSPPMLTVRGQTRFC